MQQRLLDTKEAARRLGLHPQTLVQWRCQARGPEYKKLGGAVRYDPVALRRWVEARTRRSTSDPVATADERGAP